MSAAVDVGTLLDYNTFQSKTKMQIRIQCSNHLRHTLRHLVVELCYGQTWPAQISPKHRRDQEKLAKERKKLVFFFEMNMVVESPIVFF
jgi:hypothetical protein